MNPNNRKKLSVKLKDIYIEPLIILTKTSLNDLPLTLYWNYHIHSSFMFDYINVTWMDHFCYVHV